MSVLDSSATVTFSMFTVNYVYKTMLQYNGFAAIRLWHTRGANKNLLKGAGSLKMKKNC